jgi:hypothetical protein
MFNGICAIVRAEQNVVLVRGKDKIRFVPIDLASGGERADFRKVFAAVYPTILNAKAKLTGFGSCFDGVDRFLNACDVDAVRDNRETLFHGIFSEISVRTLVLRSSELHWSCQMLSLLSPFE